MKDIATFCFHSKPVCTCPHCNSTTITRSGFDRGTQRYRCRNCNRTFKATAGTPVHGLHKKEKIDRYLNALRTGMSVRKAAVYVGISKTTSFTWRHKFLSSLETRSAVDFASGISTAKIIQLKYSAKGRKKPPEKHTSPSRTVALLKDGQLELHRLAPVRSTRHVAQIFTDCSAVFFATVPHKALSAGIKHSENAVKITNIQVRKPLIAEAEQQIAKLLGWMSRFKGVASKYLQHYWNWYASLFNLSRLKHETEYFCCLCTNRRSLSQYLEIKGM